MTRRGGIVTGSYCGAVTKSDPGGNDDRRSMPPADPWLETAPTSAFDLNATADVPPQANPAPVDPTSTYNQDAAPVNPAFTYDQDAAPVDPTFTYDQDAAPRRGRRGWWWALPAVLLLGCLGAARLIPFNPFDGGGTPDAAGPTSPATGSTTAPAVGGAGKPAERATTAPAPRQTATAVDPPAGNEVVYEFTAEGGRNVGSVAYTDQDGDIIRHGAVSLPWRVTFQITGKKKPLVLIAQRKKGGTGPVTCTITLGGKVLSTDTETGRYAAPQCSG